MGATLSSSMSFIFVGSGSDTVSNHLMKRNLYFRKFHCSIKGSVCQHTIACHDYELAVIITQVTTCRPDGVNNESEQVRKGAKTKVLVSSFSL